MIDPHFIDEESQDYWYDVGCIQAREVLLLFTEVQWGELTELWQTQSPVWQERLAYILGDGGTEREAALLLQMCAAASKDVALSAAEALRGMNLQIVKQACTSPCAGTLVAQARLEDCKSTNEILEVLERSRGSS